MAGAVFRAIALFGLVGVLFAAPASAADNSSGEQAAKALIERQFDAFAHDDAAGAYALASPGLKTTFADPDTFMNMVKGRYAPVYRHQSVEFGETEVDGDNVSQVLTIVDDENQVWKALYKLERQPDGTWLITGCVLIRSTDMST